MILVCFGTYIATACIVTIRLAQFCIFLKLRIIYKGGSGSDKTRSRAKNEDEAGETQLFALATEDIFRTQLVG